MENQLSTEGEGQFRSGIELLLSRWPSRTSGAAVIHVRKPSSSPPISSASLELAKKIMVMYEECLEGNFTSIERLREAIPAPQIIQGLNDDEGDSDSSSGEEEDDSKDMVVDALPNPSQKDMVVDEPRPSRIAEEDDWIVVGSKKN